MPILVKNLIQKKEKEISRCHSRIQDLKDEVKDLSLLDDSDILRNENETSTNFTVRKLLELLIP